MAQPSSRLRLPVVELSRDRARQVRIAPWVHAARIATVALLLVGLHRWANATAARSGRSAPALIDLATLVDSLPTTATVEPLAGDASAFRVRDASGTSLGLVTQTAPQSDRIVGYAGPSNVLIVMDDDGVVTDTRLLRCPDTAEHLRQVENDPVFWNQFIGWKWGDTAAVQVDGVSGATLTSLAIAEAVAWRLAHPPGATAEPVPQLRRSSRFAEPIAVERLRRWFPEIASVREAADEPFLVDCLDAAGQSLGRIVRTGPLHDSVIGYQGPTEVIFRLAGAPGDAENPVVVDAMLGESFDNQPYLGYVQQEASFWKRFRGRTLESLAALDLQAEGIDGVSGATMTSIAVAETIRDASAAWLAYRADLATHAARELAAAARDAGPGRRLGINVSWTESWTMALAVGAIFWSRSRWRGDRTARTIWQVIVLVSLGLICGNLLSMALLGGWTRGGVAWRLAPGLTGLALVAVLAPAIFKGNVYCDHLCPHGILQQWLRPTKKRPFAPLVQQGLRLSALAVIAVTLIGVVLPLGVNLGWLEPFDAYAGGLAIGVSVIVWGLSILLARWSPMAYCRHACPTGRVLDYVRRDASRHRLTTTDLALVAATLAAWVR